MPNHKPDDHKANLKGEIVGYWAQDVWCSSTLPICEPAEKMLRPRVYYRFAAYSDGVNQELKYALKLLFSQKQWKSNGNNVQHALHTFIKCFNETTQQIDSLMQKPLTFWEQKLTAYMEEQGLCVSSQGLNLTKAGEKKVYTYRHRLISKFCKIWFVVADYYDGSEEWDKEVIDARRLGLSIPVGALSYRFNLSTITPLWLQKTTPHFLRYHANHSAYNTLVVFLASQKRFSRYLAVHFPQIRPEHLERQIITGFIADLHKRLKPSTISTTIGHLKWFLETCDIHGLASFPDKILIPKNGN